MNPPIIQDEPPCFLDEACFGLIKNFNVQKYLGWNNPVLGLLLNQTEKLGRESVLSLQPHIRHSDLLGEISFLIVNIISRFLPRGRNDEDQVGMISTDFMKDCRIEL